MLRSVLLYMSKNSALPVAGIEARVCSSCRADDRDPA